MVAVVSVVFALSCSMIITTGWMPASASELGPPFGPVTEYAGIPMAGQMEGVSCTSAGNCTAVGEVETAFAIYATETSGTWGPATVVAGLAGELHGVSCTLPGDCTAVGQSTHLSAPIYVTESNGVWGAPAAVLGGGGVLESVSCTDVTDCTAVGVDAAGNPAYAIETAGTWGAMHEVTPLIPGSGALYSVSCADATDCTAVGNEGSYAIDVTESSGAWSGATEVTSALDGETLYGVSCTSAGDCTAVGRAINPLQPIYATETSGSWSGTTEFSAPGGGGQFGGISCFDATHCTAVGFDDNEQPFYATETSGSWSGATEISAPDASAGFDDISCTSATDCTAVGNDLLGNPAAVTESGGIWGAATEVSTPSMVGQGIAIAPGYNTFDAVSCTTATDCTAVGMDANLAGGSPVDGQPIGATETSGVWDAVHEFVADNAVPPTGQFYGVELHLGRGLHRGR